MVRLGFIVEGDSEKMMVESDNFQSWASAQGLEICRPVINAKGGGNLLPRHMEVLIATLAKSKPDHVVVLTDLEDAPDIAAVKARITDTYTSLIFVAVKALEAWFLADTEAMRAWLKKPSFLEDFPEATPGMPWVRLKEVAQQQGARGPGPNKVKFAKRFCETHNFQIANAAAHPACHSAKNFHDALLELSRSATQVEH